MKKYLRLLSIIILIICSSSCHDDLQSNPTIKSIFNQSEIKDLSIILDFFNDQICSSQQIDKSNICDCYKSYFVRLNKAKEIGNIDINIPFKSQQILYTQIRDSTFKEIWSFEKSWIPHTSDTLKNICFNPKGKYIGFLREFGKENELIKHYHDTYMEAGDISPTMVAGLLEHSESYDLNDIRVQLFVAVHYLTLNDQFERKEKY